MRTSNKLLIGLLVAFLCVPTFIFLSFRYKLDHGEYTLNQWQNQLSRLHLPPYRVLELLGQSQVFLQQDTINALFGEDVRLKRFTYELRGDTLRVPDASGFVVHLTAAVSEVIADSVGVDYSVDVAPAAGGPHFLMRNSDFHYGGDENSPVLDSLFIRSVGPANIDIDKRVSVRFLDVDLEGPVTLDLTGGRVDRLSLSGGDSATLNVPGYLLRQAFTPAPSHPAKP